MFPKSIYTNREVWVAKKEGKTLYYVYIVECKDGSYYTGWTMDIESRLAKHNQGKGAKYTRSRYPVVLRYSETFESKSEAMCRECAIKKMSREDKIKLITDRPI